MKRVTWLLLFSFFIFSCSSYSAVRLPERAALDLAQCESSSGVDVGLSFMDKADIQRYFDTDMIEKGVQPIFYRKQLKEILSLL